MYPLIGAIKNHILNYLLILNILSTIFITIQVNIGMLKSYFYIYKTIYQMNPNIINNFVFKYQKSQIPNSKN
jgi:hypothetical protein